MKAKKRPEAPIGDPIQHGNLARIDPKKNLVSDYEFYSVVHEDYPEGQANLPMADHATVEKAKHEVDANHK